MNSSKEVARQFLKNHDLEHDDKVDELAGMIDTLLCQADEADLFAEIELVKEGISLAAGRENSSTYYMELKELNNTVDVVETRVRQIIREKNELQEKLDKIKAMAEEAMEEKKFQETDETWRRIMGDD